ncbi:MAG TPA: pilus (MSHA type) biogenesis protein MshL, partial [Burkholderiaceae bacterium]|nr:pilus (MSHA type) biogenesis protein MshL [Burkholderiaceae bacterium]
LATLNAPSRQQPAALPPDIAQALVPPVNLAMPDLGGHIAEPRFDLEVIGLPVAQVFTALARDTRYSIVLDPALKGDVSVSLKDVTLLEALDTLRELYGYEYRVQGNRIFVQNAALTTRVFQINYLNTQRSGRSDVRVTSGSIAQGSGSNTSGDTQSTDTASSNVATSESSRITTQMRNDLWTELESSLRLLLGAESKPAEGRQLIVSPQSGVVVVRAYPRELRAIEQYLRAARLNVERQVMLEAKIVDVRLSESTQSGINWAAFFGGGAGDNHGGGVGLLNPGTTLGNSGSLTAGTLAADPGNALALGAASGSGLLGLAFQTSNFAALISFLETQGDVQVLSSPRIAALNNQKAVLKVGTDDFFVTSVSTNIQNTSGSSGNVVTPTITVQPFFSGIALDVTPQIDEDGNITLHIHPSISNVTERNKVLNLGDLGSFTLPLASSSVSETDTIVRARDGNIVAIGGLMKTTRSKGRQQVPGMGELPLIGALFGSRNHEVDKHELVILIKPTVIHSDQQNDALRAESLKRIEAMTQPGQVR